MSEKFRSEIDKQCFETMNKLDDLLEKLVATKDMENMMKISSSMLFKLIYYTGQLGITPDQVMMKLLQTMKEVDEMESREHTRRYVG